MTLTKEELDNITSVEKLINITATIRKECTYAYCENGMATNKEIEEYELLEPYAYEQAVKNATNIEELESCATAIEENSIYHPDPDAWAAQIRIKAYGLVWYLKRQLNHPAHKEFVNYLNDNGIENPLKVLELAINC